MNTQKTHISQPQKTNYFFLGEKISVVIPVYNVEKYIGRCLDSILANDYNNLEIICINDGSTDNGLDVLLQYACIDNRIIVINSCNGGVSKARNIGLEICSGEYVAFIDADDCVHSQYFSIMHEKFNEKNVGAVLCKWERFSEKNKVTENKNVLSFDCQKYTMSELLKTELCQNCWARLYKRSAISSVRFPVDLAIYEDGVFTREVMWKNREKQAVIIDYPLYYYFIRKGSATHSHNFLPARYSTINCYINKGASNCNRLDKEFWMRLAIESALDYRYYASIQKDYEHVKNANNLIKESMKIILKHRLFSLKTRIRFSILSAFPVVHKKINKLD